MLIFFLYALCTRVINYFDFDIDQIILIITKLSVVSGGNTEDRFSRDKVQIKM